jgi:hypothetical protein
VPIKKELFELKSNIGLKARPKSKNLKKAVFDKKKKEFNFL